MRTELRRTFTTVAALSAALIACIATPRAVAAQTGSISGKVSDRSTQQPIEAVTVTVEGTSYGILTKANGTYTILGVPPGTYNVTAKRVGYQAVTAQNVIVRADISRTQDFELVASGYLPLAPMAQRAGPVLAASTASAGPGSAFGIDAYDCANCGVARYRDSVHAVYTFGAEPVVVAVSPLARDRIRPGDVIVAVNGNPITTRAGADMFAYPDSGEIKLTLRRNGTNIDVFSYSLNSIRASVAPQGTVGSGAGGFGAAAGGRGGAGGFAGGGGAGRSGRGGAGGVAAGGRVSPTAPAADSALRARLQNSLCVLSGQVAAARSPDSTQTARRLAPCPPDSLRTEAQRLARVSAATLDSARPQRSAGSRGGATVGRGTAVGGGAGAGTGSAVGGGIAAGAAAPDIITSNVELRNYGFSLSCRPDCTRIRARTGIVYWKFDGYPTVAVQTLVKDGIAAKAGIREGDVLITVNGLSPLSEEGAVLLNRSDRELELTLEFSRAGKHEKYVLKL